MPSSPAARCQHIRTSGTQCGSPALRHKNFCYYHQRWRPIVVNLSEPGKKAHFTLPILEDAHSIQFSIAQVMHQLMDKTIDAKTAGLMLYALQIASSNLRQLTAETPRPSQVVVDLDTVAETPLEMTPPPEGGSEDRGDPKLRNRKKNGGPSEEQIQRDLNALVEFGKHLYDSAPVSMAEMDLAESIARRANNYGLTPDAIEHRRELALDAQRRENEGKQEAKQIDPSGDSLPPGTIQACVRSRRSDKGNEKRFVN